MWLSALRLLRCFCNDCVSVVALTFVQPCDCVCLFCEYGELKERERAGLSYVGLPCSALGVDSVGEGGQRDYTMWDTFATKLL